MNKLPPVPIVEWSPKGVTVFDPASGKLESAAEVATALARVGNPKQVVLALARRQTFLKAVRLPDIALAEAKNILSFQLEELFPIETETIAYDLQWTDDRNQDGRLAAVVAVKEDVFKQARSEINAAGAKVVRTVPAFVGSAEIARMSGMETCLVLETSPEGTAFDVVKDGTVVYSRTAPSDLSLEQLDAEIVRTLAAAQVASAPVVTAETFEGRSFQHSAKRSLEALAETHTDYDLHLSDEIKKLAQKETLQRRNFAILAFIAVLTIATSFYLDRDDKAKEIAKARVSWDRDIRRLESELKIANGDLSKYDDKGTLVLSAFAPKQYASDVYAAASNAVTPGVWVTNINFEFGRPMTIRGNAKTSDQVADFVSSLSADSRFRDVTLAYSNNATIEDTPVVQFSITAHVIGNYPLVDPPKTNKRGAK